uniref:Uncharacterized protein n=1 Tax=Avena sativa TaxID=4498 RepID=A0ACD5XR69_AVESA
MTLNPLLNNAHYDVQHRAYKMSEKRQELQPLRLRYHEVSSGKMRYDARWGSAALAWLYRQLDDACLRSAADSGIGGCLLLLSVWSWERFSIGRPRLLSFNPYIDNGNEYLLPTWAYKWDVVSEPPTDPLEAYKRYTNEFDTITMDQVTWEPYGRGDRFGVPEDYRLNPICLRESRLWLMRCPMVCMWAVEYHQPHRVMTQFGLFQIVPHEWKDTDIGLHSLDRKKQRKEKDWPNLHRKHLEKFRRCVTEARKAKGAQDRPFNRDAFNNYIAWFVDNARVEIYPRAFQDSILEEPLVFDELPTEQYNIMVREGRQTEFAPLVNFVRDHVRKSADACEDALDTYPRGEKGEGLFREFVKKKGQRLRRLSNLLGCRDPEVATPSASRSNTPEGDNSGDHHSTSEDEANTPEPQDEESVPDEMTLGNYTRYKVHERSDYMFKPRQPKKPYTPNPSTTKTKKPKNPYRLEVEDEEEPRRRKMPTRRGRGAKTTRGK